MRIGLLLFLLLPFVGFAQSPSIKVYNLMSITTYDYILVDTIAVPDSIVLVDIAFKVENVQNADTIYFNIGTTDGGAETASIIYEVTYSQGIYYLDDGVRTFQFYGENIYLQFEIRFNEIGEYVFFETWGRDNSGVLTTKEKFNY